MKLTIDGFKNLEEEVIIIQMANVNFRVGVNFIAL